VLYCSTHAAHGFFITMSLRKCQPVFKRVDTLRSIRRLIVQFLFVFQCLPISRHTVTLILCFDHSSVKTGFIVSGETTEIISEGGFVGSWLLANEELTVEVVLFMCISM
jgi:hypothetical protein